MRKKLLFGILLSLALIIGGAFSALSQPAYAADGVTVRIDIGSGHTDLFNADTIDALASSVGDGEVEAALSEDGTKIILEGIASTKTEARLRSSIANFVAELEGDEDWLIDNGELYEAVGYKSFDEYKSFEELDKDINHSGKKHNVPIKDGLTYYILWGEPYTTLKLGSGDPVCGKAAENAMPTLPKGIKYYDGSEDPDDSDGPGYSWEDEDEVESFKGGNEYSCTVVMTIDPEGDYWRCFFDEDNMDVTVVGGEVVKIDADTPGLLYVTFKATADHDWEEVADSTEPAAAAEGEKTFRCKSCGATETFYDLWVGGVQVTSANKDDILKGTDPLNEGNASFDPATNTLTLDRAMIGGETEFTENGYPRTANIYSTGIDLRIVLKGVSDIEGDDTLSNYAIYTDGYKETEITGTGSLLAEAETSVIDTGHGNCLINGGKIEASSQKGSTVFVWSNLVINGGRLSAKSDSKTAIVGGDGVEINDGTVYATGLKAGIVSYADMTINGGNVNATSLDDGITASGDMKITGGNVTASGTEYGILSRSNVMITGGNVEATATGDEAVGIYAWKNLEIRGGNVNASGKGKGSYSGIEAFENVTINGGTVTASSNNNGIILDTDGTMTITGGSVNAKGAEDGLYAGDGKVAITGGNVTAFGGNGCGICAAETTIGKGVTGLVSAGTVYAIAGFDDKTDKYIGAKVKNAIAGNGWTDTEGKGEGTRIDINTAGRELAYKKVMFPVDTTPVGSVHDVSGSKYVVTSADAVSLVKAKSRKSYKLPATVKIEGKTFNVTGINARAFKGTKVKTLTVRTKKLTKKSVKGSLKGSKVKTVKVKVGKKKVNKKYVKKYKKYFTKKNAGRKVKVK